MFVAAHYAALVIFVVACWGFGRALLSRIGAPVRRDVWLETAMAATAGVGIFVCLFQAIAIAGALNRFAVLAGVAAGVAAAGAQLPGWLREVRARDIAPPLLWIEKLALGALMLTALPALVAPLAPPAAFDELMYHLPYAREVASSGALGIHEWLRYPWFPYNYDLLYAGALTVGDDVLPHFLNALAGGLSVWILYRVGLQHASRLTGCIAAAIWLGLSDYSNALIDISVALFVLAACVALWWWREAEPAEAPRWLALAAFFLGLAAGAKYQALTVLPLVAFFVVRRERRVRVWAVAGLCFLIPCIYWYARNAAMTGDPFNPIGARIFGFTNWNLDDYRNQLQDVRDHAALPSALVWAVLLAPLSGYWKRSAALRAAGVFCAYSLVVWVLTSRYPRYLSSAFPLLALTAVLGWQVVFGKLAAGLRRAMPRWNASGALGYAGRWFGVLLLVAATGVSLFQTRKNVAMIAVTPIEREAFLRKHVPGYAVMNYLREHAVGRVYQIGLIEATYYGPVPVWGDTIGPWRYADFILGRPVDNARKLAGLGFEAIAVAGATATLLEAQPGFHDNFALMYEQDGAKAYRILPYKNDSKP